MQTYKLAYGGATTGVGLSQVQIIKTGRVVAVAFALALTPNAVGDYATVQCGVNAVSENGVATANPSNFAAATVPGLDANINAVNTFVVCDYPVQAGQSLMLNIAANAANGTLEQCEVWVTVK